MQFLQPRWPDNDDEYRVYYCGVYVMAIIDIAFDLIKGWLSS